ncbi:MAG TPA: carboxypeptidase regulatory-like domain-containing protein [Longimicrobiales bacterium]
MAGATIIVLDTGLVRRAEAVADDSGAFELRLPGPGRYRLQAAVVGEAGGEHTGPLSEVFEVGAGEAVGGIVLRAPSALEVLAAGCPAEARRSGRAVLVGVVYEGGHGVALPGAWVMLTWDPVEVAGRGADGEPGAGAGGSGVGSAAAGAGRGGVEGAARGDVVRADGGGRYRVCGVPVGVAVRAQVEALGGGSAEVAFTVPEAPVARAELAVGLGLGTSRLAVLAREPRSELGERGALSGRVVDAASGAPVAGVVVRVGERTELSDTAGAFRLAGLGAGAAVLELEHVSYGVQREAVRLEAGREVVVRIELAPRPIALEGIEVESRRGRGLFSPASAVSSTYVVAGEALREAQRRGTPVANLLRSRFPGLTITRGTFSTRFGDQRGSCAESNHRVERLRTPEGKFPFCDAVPVIVDGVAVARPLELLSNLRVDTFESIEFVSSIDAAALYGMDAGAAGGALVLWTRGRGPHVSEARNPR